MRLIEVLKIIINLETFEDLETLEDLETFEVFSCKSDSTITYDCLSACKELKPLKQHRFNL